MKKADVVRAWRDPEYRKSLSQAERDALPPSPVGDAPTHVSDDALRRVSGGGLIWSLLTRCEEISAEMSSSSRCCCFT